MSNDPLNKYTLSESVENLSEDTLYPEVLCLFCKTEDLTIVMENKTVFAIMDSSPVSSGHMLIITRRHCCDYFEMTRQERCDAHELIKRLKKKILKNDSGVTGFNIGVNCGKSAGQTVFHTHIHLIPRKENDTPSPRGGVRGVIPDKMNY
jgi:ATP adenylyltransferase